MTADGVCFDITRVFGCGIIAGTGLGMLAGALWAWWSGRKP